MCTSPRFHSARRCGIICLWLAGLSIGCQQPNEYQPPPPPTVTVAQPVQKTVTEYLEETGTTEAVAKADVRARVKGFLEKMHFEAGAAVERGDLLYTIEQREYRARVAAADAQLKAGRVELNRADVELRRQKELIRDNATSERELELAQAARDAAEADVAAAEAQLDQARLDLEYTEVKAPISGRVGKTLVKEGNLVGETEATQLTTVIAYDPIYANFNISEQSLLALRTTGGEQPRDVEARHDITLWLRRANDRDFAFEGRFDYADLAVDQSTGTFMIRGIFPNPDNAILPGLFVRVRVPIGEQPDALLVPERALAGDQAGRYVLVVDADNVVQRRDVTVGTKYGQLMVVEEGLEPDAWVVIDGIQRSRPGAQVDPQRAELSVAEGELEMVEASSLAPAEEAANDTAADGEADTVAGELSSDTTPDNEAAAP